MCVTQMVPERKGLCQPQDTEDFTLPHRFHVDSRWTPGQYLGSMWSLDNFSLVITQPNFCLESMWSPCGVCLDSSCSIWTTWTPPQNTGKYKFTQPDSIWTPHGLIAFNCVTLFIYKISACTRIELSSPWASVIEMAMQLTIEPQDL
jgi:hypothetical protein